MNILLNQRSAYKVNALTNHRSPRPSTCWSVGTWRVRPLQLSRSTSPGSQTTSGRSHSLQKQPLLHKKQTKRHILTTRFLCCRLGLDGMKMQVRISFYSRSDNSKCTRFFLFFKTISVIVDREQTDLSSGTLVLLLRLFWR